MARLFYALIDPHDVFFLAYHSTQIEGGGQFNRSRVKDPKHRRADPAGRGREPTRRERMAIYQELQQTVMEKALILPAFDTALAHGCSRTSRASRRTCWAGRT